MKRRVGMMLVIPFALIAIAVAVAGCGSRDSESASGGGEGFSKGEKEQSAEVLKRLIRGSYEAPPEAIKPEPGKEIELISCGQAFSTCANAIGGAAEAAEAMGWKTSIFDTKGDPGQAAAGIRQGIVSKVDGIYVWYTDCRYMKPALQEAKAAGIPVVAAESFDCNYEHPDEEPSFTAEVTFAGGEIYPDWIADYGREQAEFLVAEAEGKAKVIVLLEEGLLGAEIQQQEILKTLKECSGCSAYPVNFTLGDLSTGLQQKTEQALLEHPDANALVVPYDAVLLSGVSTGVQAANRPVMIMAAEGLTATMDLVREGKVTGGLGNSSEWEGYAGMEDLNRLFQGEPTVPSGIGHQVYTKEDNTPPSGPYKPPFDFRAEYTKAWGLAG